MPKVKMKQICEVTKTKVTFDPSIIMKSRATRGLYDTGADECTTNDPYIVHDLAVLPASERVTLFDAGKNPHYNFYGGYAILNGCDGKQKRIPIKYTPSLRVTAIDPSKFRNTSLKCLEENHVQRHSKHEYYHHCIYSNGTQEKIPLLRVWRKSSKIDRYYTFPFEKVSKDVANRYDDMLNSENALNKEIQVRSTMNRETINILWHFRLGHAEDGRIVGTSKSTKGIHNFRPRTTIEKCDTCSRMRIKTKSCKIYNRILRETKLPILRKAPPPDIVKQKRNYTFFQHIHMDFGFMVSKRKDESAYKRLVAHNGDTCYLAIQCSATDFACGKASGTKVAPIEWLHFLLLKYTPWNQKGSTVQIDDGELFATDFIALFEKFGYFVDTTGPDNSSANSKVERFHVDVKEGIMHDLWGLLVA